MGDKLIAIVGPTGSGKSSLAMQLAEQFDGEIIAADAWTVRKGADIGTAKPSVADRKRVTHHLLDIVEPCQDFTAAVFKDLAQAAIDDIQGRGKLSIMVGGTGLYIDAVLYDYGFLPAGDRLERQKLEELDIAELLKFAQKQHLDTSNIDIRNKRRIIRLLETQGAQPTKKNIRPNTLALGIDIPTNELYGRIASRVDYMLRAGLESEVRGLLAKYGSECQALKGIGYREWLPFIEGDITKEQIRDKIIRSSRALVKKQGTWLKRNNSIHWIKKQSEAVALVTTFLNK